jgi:hypothetical protein
VTLIEPHILSSGYSVGQSFARGMPTKVGLPICLDNLAVVLSSGKV